MYRSCIFCSADLGSNDSIEAFPIGRSLAFDAEKGRLWAVCPRCARWNLAPLEERWEAIEDAERLFRDTRLRVQSENVGLAKLRDGTRLIRVGQALGGELAAWRYGQRLVRKPLVPQLPRLPGRVRRTIDLATSGPVLPALMMYALMTAPAVAAAAAAPVLLGMGAFGAAHVHDRWRKRRVVHALADPADAARHILIRYDDLSGTRLTHPEDGHGAQLFLPYSRQEHAEWQRHYVNLRGPEAQAALARVIVHVNARGAPAETVANSVEMVAQAGSPEVLVRDVAQMGAVLSSDAAGHPGGIQIAPVARLALEIALHEEQERRALDGELAMLEALWREAEEIAAIADRLPDHLPPSEPPRIAG